MDAIVILTFGESLLGRQRILLRRLGRGIANVYYVSTLWRFKIIWLSKDNVGSDADQGFCFVWLKFVTICSKYSKIHCESALGRLICSRDGVIYWQKTPYSYGFVAFVFLRVYWISLWFWKLIFQLGENNAMRSPTAAVVMDMSNLTPVRLTRSIQNASTFRQQKLSQGIVAGGGQPFPPSSSSRRWFLHRFMYIVLPCLLLFLINEHFIMLIT